MELICIEIGPVIKKNWIVENTMIMFMEAAWSFGQGKSQGHFW